jgi:hypothetical protein
MIVYTSSAHLSSLFQLFHNRGNRREVAAGSSPRNRICVIIDFAMIDKKTTSVSGA